MTDAVGEIYLFVVQYIKLNSLKKFVLLRIVTSPPSARVAVMSDMQQ